MLGILAGWAVMFCAALSMLAYDVIGDGGGSSVGTGTSQPTANPGTPPNKRSDPKGKEAEPVDMFSGQFEFEATDVNIPGRVPLRVRRFYRSGSTYQGLFGRGWNMEYNERILIMATNGNLLLRRNNTVLDEFANRGNSTFAPPVGCYDALNRNGDGTYTLREKYGTIRNYNTDGCLTEIRDRNLNQLLFTYQPGGKLPINAVSDYSHYSNAILVARDYQLARIEVALSNVLSGRFVRFSYDSNGRVTNVTDFTGRAWRYDYDSAGRGLLQAVTTPPVSTFTNGLTTTYSYPSTNAFRLMTITDPAGQTYLTNFYDSAGLVWKQLWGAAAYSFAYPSATTHWVTNGNGYRIARDFDTNGNVVSLKQYTAGLRASDPPVFVSAYTYDTNFEQTKLVYPAGNVEQRKYDTLGNLLELRRKVTNSSDGPTDLVTTYSYESNFNFIKTATDPNTNVTTYIYDYEVPSSGRANGNLAQIVYPNVGGTSPTVSFGYTASGQVSMMTNAVGVVTKFVYDDTTGYPLQRIEAFGTSIPATNSSTYDPRGNILTATDPLGHTKTYAYDSLDRLVQTTTAGPFNYVTKYSYGANGKVAGIQRQTGDGGHAWQTTSFGYDVLDRLKAVTNDLGQATQYSYDGNGNRTRLTDANTNSTTYVYDERNLLWQVTDALTNVTQYAYDQNGNLAKLTDARTNATLYAYDGYDRLSTNAYADSSFEAYTYDQAGDLQTKRTRAGQVASMSYDALNRLVLAQFPDGASNAFTFDAASQLRSVTDTNGVMTFAYDALGRLTTTTNTFGKRIAYEYDAAGNRSKLYYPDGSFITYGYDALNRLTNIADNAELTIANFSYDALGRRSELDFGNGTRASYGYDWANNLTNLLQDVPATASKLAQFAYSCDNVGNRLTMTTAYVPFSGTHSYTYDKTYQLTGAAYPAGYPFPNEILNYDSVGNRTTVVSTNTTAYAANNLNQYSSVGGVPLRYDLNGNLTNDGTMTLSFDFLNRLNVAARAGTNATYRYDAFGRRIEKNINGAVRRFVYANYQLIAETDAGGNVLTKNVFGAGIDEVLRTDSGASSYYYHVDALGSVRCLTDTAGGKAESYSYNAYGSVTGFASTPLTRFLFTGREYDAELGLFDYRARRYNIQLGRFAQPDPIGYSGGINLYRYAFNSPIMYSDPFGLSGTLVIYSSGTSGLGNHSWISYTPDGSGTATTYGTWGNNPTGSGNGLFTNLEQGRGGDATRSAHLDDSQEASLNQTINGYRSRGEVAWTYGGPCSTFASDAWNNATGEHLSPYWGPISNPTSLTKSITDANGGTPNGTSSTNKKGSSSYGGSSSYSSSSSAANSSTTPLGNSSHGSGSF